MVLFLTLQDGRIIVEGDLRVGLTLERQKIRQFLRLYSRESDRDEHPDHSVGHS